MVLTGEENMTIKELRALDIPERAIEEISVNALDVIRNQEWDKKHPKCYRERSIDRVLSLKIPFTSEYNTLRELLRRVIHITCPICNKKIEVDSSGGSLGHQTFMFSCDKCNLEINLTLPVDCLRLYFRKGE
jgi:hypothetical protein